MYGQQVVTKAKYSTMTANLNHSYRSGAGKATRRGHISHNGNPMGPPFIPPTLLPHKHTRKHERPLHKLTRTSAHRTLVFIFNTLFLRIIQERININDLRLYRRLEVLARRIAVVPPAVCLHDEQVEQRHDGYIVDMRSVGREDRREVDDAQSQYVDFDAAAVGVPGTAGRAGGTLRSCELHCDVWSAPGTLAICVDYDFFDTLGVGIWVMD